MHENSNLLFMKYALEYFLPGRSVLEIGPDLFPSTYQRVAGNKTKEWHTLDLYQHPSLTYTVASEYEFPIQDNSYDIILSGQVMEHVRKPWVWMKELGRVCRTGGFVITICPVSWTYHEQPVYNDASLEVLMSKWESLENPGYRNYFPGISRMSQTRWQSIFYSIFGPFGYPVERSYDTITIGRKDRA